MNAAGRISWISRGEIGSPQVTSYGSERLADYVITVRDAVMGAALPVRKAIDYGVYVARGVSGGPCEGNCSPRRETREPFPD
jgi:hypothetical protein